MNPTAACRTRYQLFQLTNSGGPGATLSSTTISSPFNPPTRRVNQPFTTATLDPSDGNILWTPYFDGVSIWFAHTVDFVGFPTIRYGAVNVSAKTVTTALAFHSGRSDDFDAAIGAGLNPGGAVSVYLTWAFGSVPARRSCWFWYQT